MNSQPGLQANPPKCYSIPAGQPFAKTLATWVLSEYGQSAAALTRMLILLPNRRACRTLREAFLEASGGKPILLPRIQPIGDIDEGALFAYHDANISDIPPPMAATRRLFLLMRLVMRFQHKQEHAAYSYDQAVSLARQLAQFIDDAAREGITLDRLQHLVPEELARHWQETLEFLNIISRHWPEILAGEGAIDPVEHRNRLLLATAKAWIKYPPDYPIIAAGSTGSQPATAALISAIARLPEGRVILPALDTTMPESEWDDVSCTHPQYGLKQLLGAMECRRAQVKILAESSSSPRVEILKALLQPPAATAKWSASQLPLKKGLSGMQFMVADTLLDEARMIAIALREVLEIPKKTAALITPDRTLARMVAAQMQRFGVSIDDSAGQLLRNSPPAAFMRLVIEVASSKAAPSSLLALLRHPLAAAGFEPAECRRLSRELEIQLLRGTRHAPGLKPLLEIATRELPQLKPLLSSLTHIMQPLDTLHEQKNVPLAQLITTHISCAEALASMPGENGADRLWSGEAGNALAAFIADILAHGDILDAIDPASYAGLFNSLLSTEIHRPRHGLHPRLHILSPIEARLQQFDKVILGGLNEDVWPSPTMADPWMSRPMRADFGLPSPERVIGQSAHDLFMLCASGEVLLSRAAKTEGTPTVPSRWLLRLETLVRGLDEHVWQQLNITSYYAQGKAQLDAPVAIEPLKRPMPKPPLEARPRKLRVTAIDNWLREPYMIYAQYILRLDMLKPLDEEPDAADFGTQVHKAIEQFSHRYPKELPTDPLAALLECGQMAFAEVMDRPAVACLWWPRFEAMAGWLIEQEQKRRGSIRVLSELKGSWELNVDGKPFTLTTTIDRLEIHDNGRLTLGDYKTGYVPTKSEIEKGLANQLLLEALIVQNGSTHADIPKGSVVSELEYWKLAADPTDCSITPVNPEHVAEAQERLISLIRRFDALSESYVPSNDPSQSPRYNDYEHLTRRQEWEAV